MSRQAQVGVFAIIALLLLFGVFYVITDFGTRHTGYKIGVHFQSAAGLPTGALVYFSGVTAGSVDQIALLPDNTVDVILAINRDINIPVASRFLIQAPLTGSPSLIIVPPQSPTNNGLPTTPQATLARQVLPVERQPVGENSATIADLLQEGQGEIARLDKMLTQLQQQEPKLLGSLQETLNNANRISQTADASIERLSAQSEQIADTLQSSLGEASSNVVAMTDSLNSTVGRNSHQIDHLLTSLNKTAVALNQSMDSLRDLSGNRQIKQNVIDTTQNIADLTQTIAELAHDLRNVTGNTQTQGQLRDTVAQIDAASQKANSLLSTLGGRSHVYGVDAGATPYPVPSGSAGAPPLSPQPNPNPSAAKSGLGSIVHNLYAVQIRTSELSRQRVAGSNPLLGVDRGPQSDVNLILLPSGGTSFVAGANDLGGRTTYNFAGVQNLGHGVRAGAGVLYSRLGVLGNYTTGRLEFEGRAYDLRRPTLDVYGNLRVTDWAKLFLGQRDLTHTERRTVLGLQLQF